MAVRQPTADSMHWYWQLQASQCTIYIWIPPPFTNIPSNTSVAWFPLLLLHKRGIFFSSAAGFCRVYPPKGTKTAPTTKDRAAVIDGCLGSLQRARRAEIASLSTHCFCPQPSFWASVWAAATSWSQRCGRWCDTAKLLTQGSRADGTFWIWAKMFPQLGRSSILLLFIKYNLKKKKGKAGFKGNSCYGNKISQPPAIHSVRALRLLFNMQTHL